MIELLAVGARHRRRARRAPTVALGEHIGSCGVTEFNALFDRWWTGPLAGLGIVYVAGRAGIKHWRTEQLDGCC